MEDQVTQNKDVVKSQVSRKELYEMIRNQIEHEDALVNQRLNWLLISQAFLFSAFTAILMRDKSTTSLNPNHVSLILLSITLVGVVLNGLSFLGIRAAYDSLKNLRNTWYHPHSNEKESQQLNKGFPQITWVGERGWGAINTAKGMPIVVIVIWVVLTFVISPNLLMATLMAICGLILLVWMVRDTFIK